MTVRAVERLAVALVILQNPPVADTSDDNALWRPRERGEEEEKTQIPLPTHIKGKGIMNFVRLETRK